MNVPDWPPRTFPLAHATVPLLVSTQLGRSLTPAPPAMFSVQLAARVSVPARVPAVQPIVPRNTALVLPASTPLSTVNKPLGLTVNGPFNASVWPASDRITGPAP